MTKANILLVEDNPADQTLTLEAFKGSRWVDQLAVVEDGAEALSFLRREGKYATSIHPDLILLDLNLPRKDGKEVLKVIKANPKLRRFPVVVLTSSEAQRDINACYELHANCFISKPIDLQGFFGVIRRVEQFWFSLVELPGHEIPWQV
jgi:two-component system, chemotaxis family, response regulator Rcp1